MLNVNTIQNIGKRLHSIALRILNHSKVDAVYLMKSYAHVNFIGLTKAGGATDQPGKMIKILQG
jgi:hypothetical protein